MITSKTTFKIGLLAISIAMTAPIWANPAQQIEIEQLRQEVQALRALIEKQHQQQTQTAQVVEQIQKKAEISTSKNQPTLASGATFKVYGNVRLDASYQAEGSSADRLYNNINKVPLEGQKEASDRFKSTLSATRLGMDVPSRHNGKNVAAKVEVDFLGGSSLDNLRIRHAYLNYGNWLIGQTWSNFAVPDYMPETIDALGYVGGAVKRTPQIRYTHALSPNTHLVLAAEDPKDASSQMRIPAVTARLNHQINEDGRFSLRTMANEKRTHADETIAWGIGLGLQYKISPSTTFKTDYYHVKGDASFVSWTNPGFSQNAEAKILDENEFDSITVGLTQQFNEKWRGTLGVGYMNADVSNRYKAGTVKIDEVNNKLWQGWANLFYSPIKPMSFGLEYVYGEREAIVNTENGNDTGQDNRVNAVAMYHF